MNQRACTTGMVVVTTLALIFSPLLTFAFNNTLASLNGNVHDSIHYQTHLSVAKGTPKPGIDPTPFQIKTIVIDAGHGGKDPGCSGPGSTEKHLTLAIAQAFATRVQATFPDIRVILTRDDDTFIPLYERAAIANRAHADLFVSIHCNALPASKATWGSETYVMGLHTADHNLDVAKRENEAILLEENYEKNYDYDPNSPEGHILLSMFQNAYLEQSILFAERVEYHFKATADRRSRGVKQAGFVVLKETTMPSALVETGFLTSPKDEAFLKTETGQHKVADALLEAFREYKATIEGTTISDLPVAQSPAPPPSTPPSTSTKAAPSTAVSYQSPRSIPNNDTAPQRNYAPPTNDRAVVQTSPTLITPTGPPRTTTPRQQAAPQRVSAPKATQSGMPIQFSVQLAASPQPVHTGTNLWQNSGFLIEVIEESRLFKYQVRNFKTMDEAFAAQLKLQQWGFEDAFIVAYQGGQRIALETARQLSE